MSSYVNALTCGFMHLYCVTREKVLSIDYNINMGQHVQVTHHEVSKINKILLRIKCALFMYVFKFISLYFDVADE